jgi:hypothetical protein
VSHDCCRFHRHHPLPLGFLAPNNCMPEADKKSIISQM